MSSINTVVNDPKVIVALDFEKESEAMALVSERNSVK